MAGAAKRCVRQQQRGEIMRGLLLVVNSFLSLRFKNLLTCPALSSPRRAGLRRGTNYIKGGENLASVSREKRSCLLSGLRWRRCCETGVVHIARHPTAWIRRRG